MRRPLLLLVLAALAACSRGPSPTKRAAEPTVSPSAPEGTRSQEEVAARQDGGGSTPRLGTTPHPEHGGEAAPGVRATLGPLTRFRVVPVGDAAVAPARAAVDALRARYVGYGFDLAAVVPVPSPAPGSCAELLRRVVIAPGTLFVLPGTLRCSAPFGEVNAALRAAVVPLEPLGPPGALAQRRVDAVLASVVGEVLGLSSPCRDGRTCCAVRKARDLDTLDRQAQTVCPSHAAELGRINTDAGLQ
jgi:hypothetical protein